MKQPQLTRFAVFAVVAALITANCGGSSQSSPSPAPAPTPAPSPAPAPAPSPGGTTITITSAGASPRSLIVPPGTRVTFVNNDSTAHDMSSDPHPEHTQCPEINQAGFLTPNQQRQTGNLNTVRSCGFHDHNQPSNELLTGTIVIQ